ncbi:MAG TPA: tetratricopeptide repeat protein [Burkholderiales bacterium]|nr:tetratricopeptide repeat protein [Burkholderiales bacterium]
MKLTANRVRNFLVFVLLSFLYSSVSAADFASGLDAFDQGEYKKALAEFKPLAEGGNARAEYRLGIMYAKGLGIPLNYEPAVMWLRKSAEQGYASAENDLGVLYDQGRGVPENPAEAARWFMKAAVQGHGSAQLNLASLYKEGRGEPQDSVQAFAWADTASELGEFRAAKLMDTIGKSLTPQQLVQADKLAAEYRQKYVLPFRKY